MKSILKILILATFLSNFSIAIRINKDVVLEKCGSCELDKCPVRSKCNLETVKDRCGCCDVCALEEYQLCNLPEEWIGLAMGTIPGHWHGRCGEGLECRVRKDVEPKLLEERQSICYCSDPGVACASDGQTYTHCKLHALIKSTDGLIKKISDGPCKTEPKIIGVTKSSAVSQDDHVTLACEVQGFPIPTVSWFFNRPNMNENIRLPGDSEEISLSLRGGPQITRITSHLQIIKASLKHEGLYKCMAENEFGMQIGSVSLTVIPQVDQKEEESAGWFSKDTWASDEM